MALTSDLAFDITVTTICGSLILLRCVYRAFRRCKVHQTCHRTWHEDDVWMAFSLIPLIARTTCICVSFTLNPSHGRDFPTETEAASQGMSVEDMENARITSLRLLIPSRLFYALFLWCLKLSLLSFYSRFVSSKAVIRGFWWFIVLSYIAVLITTLLECRPMSLMWELGPKSSQPACSRAFANLITMGVFNIVSDIALIILPFPTLRTVQLDLKTKLQLGFLFSLGGVVIVITTLRLPLILNQSLSQKSRSIWAAVEILCACIVANTSFFYALLRDLQRRHDTQTSATRSQIGHFYLQSLDSSKRPYVNTASKATTGSDGELIEDRPGVAC
ncbi:hypothetical protein BHE90_011773 [Fusarium euwallaceae]|uniref:Rhodopsin domain-containing protein n=5 Tax=Fusarium solani species complex TaxID=232080 RepID=A0A3M2RX20_9HYPO|nr:hypothetical protein CDV36_010517 [Fusarium kuroshium]RSL78795.1 hypothetical protein CEP51_007875 [Fusarium floridanum]RSL87472.1 hypothetical protein CEP52_015526 [Fusarium oligoseptatum]RSL92393.1 hypothetical protein CDV31_015178 [Fusarium ambrosium]RTE73807.1 hypothetical protein BHE90_011773 [Fusarium euwallaceae]